MADGFVGVFDESGVGTKTVDTTEVVVGGNTVERERVVLAGEAPSEIARVHDASPGTSDMALVVRPIVSAGMEADGHSATLGTTTDAAVSSDVAGTVSAKLRGLVKILADVWNSGTHKLNVDTGLTPLTDAQLRATPVPVSGTLTVGDGSGPLTVDGTVATTSADGADVALGATTDAAVDTDAAGSVNAHLRGLVKSTGAVSGTAVTTDANGTLQQYLRGLVKLFTTATFKAASTAAIATDPALVVAVSPNNKVAVTGADGDNATLGVTTGAAVTSDATGTLQQYLRGLVKILADMWDSTNHRLNVFVQNSTLAVTGTFWQATQPVSGTFWQTTQPVSGTVAVTSAGLTNLDETLSGNLGAAADAAVDTDATGTVNAHIRGLVKTSGSTTGAAVTSDATGTLQQYLRGLIKIFADVWDSTNHGLKLGATENHVGSVGLQHTDVTSSFTRPSDTIQYAVGDTVANSTSSVTVMSWDPRRAGGQNGFTLKNIRIYKNGTNLTNASFRLHLYTSTPGSIAGDNVAWLTSAVTAYLGSYDITMDRVFTDGATGFVQAAEHVMLAAGITGILEARAAYTPASAEVFTVRLAFTQD